jgi:hypothetical protein
MTPTNLISPPTGVRSAERALPVIVSRASDMAALLGLNAH